MKKIKYLVIALVALILITGCGKSDKLVCTMEEESTGLKMSQTVTIDYNEDKIKGLSLAFAFKAVDDSIKSNWELFSSSLDSQFKTTSSDGIKVTTKNDAKKYTYSLNMQINLAKATEDELDEYDLAGIVDSTESRAEVKKYFEDEGYTCK